MDGSRRRVRHAGIRSKAEEFEYLQKRQLQCGVAGWILCEKLDGTPAAAFNLTIEGNYFKRGTTAGGAAGGPWFATRFIDCRSHADCVNIRFTGNLFDLGQGADGGEFPAYGGNVWSDNWWADGVPASSGQSR